MNLAEEVKIIADELQEIFKTSAEELKVTNDLLFFVPTVEIFLEKDGKFVNYHQFNEKYTKEVSTTDLLNTLNLLTIPTLEYDYNTLMKTKTPTLEPKWLNEKGQKKLKRLEKLKNEEIITLKEYNQKIPIIYQKFNGKLQLLQQQKIIFGYKHFKTCVCLEKMETLSKFVSGFYQENSPLLQILKFCTKKIISNFIGHFKEILASFSKLKSQCSLDTPWKIQIFRHSKNYISVKHTRKEKCLTMNEKTKTSTELFDFAWNFEIAFEDLKCEKLSFFKAVLGQIEWKTTKDEKIEKKFLSLWSNPIYYFNPLLNPSTKKQHFCNMM